MAVKGEEERGILPIPLISSLEGRKRQAERLSLSPSGGNLPPGSEGWQWLMVVTSAKCSVVSASDWLAEKASREAISRRPFLTVKPSGGRLGGQAQLPALEEAACSADWRRVPSSDVNPRQASMATVSGGGGRWRGGSGRRPAGSPNPLEERQQAAAPCAFRGRLGQAGSRLSWQQA